MSFKAVNSTPKKKITKQFFYSWEMILVYLLIAINVLLMIFVNDVYFTSGSIQTIIRCGMEISFMALGMTFILILGEIDVSVASIMLLSAMVMGLTYENMVPSSGEAMAATMAVIAGVLAGGCCGLLNGVLVSIIKMPSVITTIGTSFLFRGIVHITLGGDFKANFPQFFEPLAWDDIGGIIPVSLIVFLAFAVIFCIILHRSKYGRQLYLVGNNKDTANYSGVRVAKTKIIAYVIMGMTTALSAMVFVGRLGGIDYTMATGYELKVIAVVVLGGVSTLGGKGKLYGPIIATFFMAFLLKSLDLFEVQQNVQKVAIGIILILAVLIPRMNKNTILRIKLRFTRKGLRSIEGTDIPHNVEEAKKKVTDFEHRMSTEDFYRFIGQLEVTSVPINRTTTIQDVNAAKEAYQLQKANLKKVNKKSKEYQTLLSQVKDKKALLEKVKDGYVLNQYVTYQETSTIRKLIKLNEGEVKGEIASNAKKIVNDFRQKNMLPTGELSLTDWKVQDELKFDEIKKAFAQVASKQRLSDLEQVATINLELVKSEAHIANYYQSKKEATNKALARLSVKKENHHEKK